MTLTIKSIEKEADLCLNVAELKKIGYDFEKVKSFYRTKIKQMLDEILTELYCVRPSIILTGDRRKQAEEMLKKLEAILEAIKGDK